MRALGIFGVLLIVSALALIACEAAKDEVNERTKQEKDFDFDVDLPLVDLGGQTGICLPAYSLGGLLAEVPGWDEIAGHIESVEVITATYAVSDNANSEAGVLTFFIGDDGTTLDDLTDDSLAFAETGTIPAAQDVAATDLIWVNDGQNVITSRLEDDAGLFVICAKFEPASATVSMNVKLTFTVRVTFIPLD